MKLKRFNLGGKSKMKKSPWNSIKQLVHHDNTECNTGNNIETENLRQGTGQTTLRRMFSIGQAGALALRLLSVIGSGYGDS